ncbi:MAG: aminotransferase class I/II-fold pyridoxal phosphate-dependent enzyme, partial [Chloroflexi bacterium]|nr:aminotransferase class I/II-fold pyridoxal phosphate-dependent enzyme [Chloroflexota bacterium]
GLECLNPKGAMYVWTRVPGGYTSEGFSNMFFDQAGVYLTPGTAFGENGAGWLRLSICIDESKLQEAVRRMEKVKF